MFEWIVSRDAHGSRVSAAHCQERQRAAHLTDFPPLGWRCWAWRSIAAYPWLAVVRSSGITRSFESLLASFELRSRSIRPSSFTCQFLSDRIWTTGRFTLDLNALCSFYASSAYGSGGSGGCVRMIRSFGILCMKNCKNKRPRIERRGKSVEDTKNSDGNVSQLMKKRHYSCIAIDLYTAKPIIHANHTIFT